MSDKQAYMPPEVLLLDICPEGRILAYSKGGNTEDLNDQQDWEGGWS